MIRIVRLISPWLLFHFAFAPKLRDLLRFRSENAVESLRFVLYFFTLFCLCMHFFLRLCLSVALDHFGRWAICVFFFFLPWLVNIFLFFNDISAINSSLIGWSLAVTVGKDSERVNEAETWDSKFLGSSSSIAIGFYFLGFMRLVGIDFIDRIREILWKSKTKLIYARGFFIAKIYNKAFNKGSKII